MSIFHSNSQHRTYLVIQEWYLVRTAYPLLPTSGATAYGPWSIRGYYQNRSIIEGEARYPRSKGKKRSFLRLLDDKPCVLPYPYNCGLVELESLILGSQRPPHPLISQPSLSIQPYKYELIAMVEKRTIEVLLCCWTDSWPKIIWREHRELESKLLGMKSWFHGDVCQH